MAKAEKASLPTPRRPMAKKKQQRYNSRNGATVVRYREEGHTWKTIAGRMGVSMQTAVAWYKRGKQDAEPPRKEGDRLVLIKEEKQEIAPAGDLIGFAEWIAEGERKGYLSMLLNLQANQ